MKTSILFALMTLLFTSCVSVRFPEEIKVHVSLPENISEENMTKIIDKIPPSLGKRNVKTRVEITTKDGTQIHEETKNEQLIKKH